MERGRRHERSKKRAIRAVRRRARLAAFDTDFGKSYARMSDLLNERKRNSELRAHLQWTPTIREVSSWMVLWFTGKMLEDTTDTDKSGNASLLAQEAGCRLEDVEKTFQRVVESGDADNIHHHCGPLFFSSLEGKSEYCVELFNRHPSLISVLSDQYRVLRHRDFILKEIYQHMNGLTRNSKLLDHLKDVPTIREVSCLMVLWFTGKMLDDTTDTDKSGNTSLLAREAGCRLEDVKKTFKRVVESGDADGLYDPRCPISFRTLLAKEARCRLEDVEKTFKCLVESGDADDLYDPCCPISFRTLEAESKYCVELFNRHPALISVVTDQYRVLRHRDFILKKLYRHMDGQKRNSQLLSHLQCIPIIREASCLMVLCFTGKLLEDTTDTDKSGNASLLAQEAGCRLEDVEKTFQRVVESGDADNIYDPCSPISFRELEGVSKDSVELFDRHPSLVSVLIDEYRVLRHRDFILEQISRHL